MASSGALDRVREHLDCAEVMVFDEAVPEPPLETVITSYSIHYTKLYDLLPTPVNALDLVTCPAASQQ